MKHFTLKSVLVITVFFIGVSINNSCGESPIDDNLSSMYNSIRTLQNEVTNLRQEIKRLDSEIASLQLAPKAAPLAAKNTLTDCIFGTALLLGK